MPRCRTSYVKNKFRHLLGTETVWIIVFKTSLMRLRPDNDSLNLDIIHSNYLAYIHRHAELRNHPSPIGHGWEMMNGHCRTVRYTKVDLPAVLPRHSRKEQMGDCSDSECESDLFESDW